MKPFNGVIRDVEAHVGRDGEQLGGGSIVGDPEPVVAAQVSVPENPVPPMKPFNSRAGFHDDA